jgi:hypothetical protein
MPKMLLARIHVAAAGGAIAVITTFLVASGVTELAFGAVNLSLLVLNFRDGRRMTRHRRTARPARLSGSEPAPLADNEL